MHVGVRFVRCAQPFDMAEHVREWHGDHDKVQPTAASAATGDAVADPSSEAVPMDLSSPSGAAVAGAGAGAGPGAVLR